MGFRRTSPSPNPGPLTKPPATEMAPGMESSFRTIFMHYVLLVLVNLNDLQVGFPATSIDNSLVFAIVIQCDPFELFRVSPLLDKPKIVRGFCPIAIYHLYENQLALIAPIHSCQLVDSIASSSQDR